jgi:putative hemolysin
LRARLPLPVGALGFGRAVAWPPLLRASVERSARVAGAPAWEPVFACAELPLLLRASEIVAAG